MWAAAGGGYGIAGDESDLGLVEVGVRCSLEQMLEEGVRAPPPHPPPHTSDACTRLRLPPAVSFTARALHLPEHCWQQRSNSWSCLLAWPLNDRQTGLWSCSINELVQRSPNKTPLGAAMLATHRSCAATICYCSGLRRRKGPGGRTALRVHLGAVMGCGRPSRSITTVTRMRATCCGQRAGTWRTSTSG